MTLRYESAQATRPSSGGVLVYRTAPISVRIHPGYEPVSRRAPYPGTDPISYQLHPGISPYQYQIHPGVDPDPYEYQLHPGVIGPDSLQFWPPIPSLDHGVTGHYINHDEDYLGFINDTTITFEHDPLPFASTKFQGGNLVFRGEPGPRFHAVSFPFQFQVGKNAAQTPVVIAVNNGDPKNWVDVNVTGHDIPRDSPYWFSKKEWGKQPPGTGVDTDRFDHVTVEYRGTIPVTIRRVTIRLNDIEIADKQFDGAGYTLHPGADLALDPYIWHRRLEYIHFIENRALFLAGHEECREILYWAASDIGQTWSPRYGKWNPDSPPSHHGSPRDWCSEFVNYTIARASRGRVIPFDFGENINTDAWQYYFESRGRYIRPTGTSYRRLGDLVRPGFYVRLNDGGHSTIFVCWCKKNKDLTSFDPGQDTNYFLAIGGNQDQHRVWVSQYAVSRTNHGLHGRSGIVWKPDPWSTFEDGFGDTSHF